MSRFEEADAAGRAVSVPAYKEAVAGCDLKRANAAIMAGHGAGLRALRGDRKQDEVAAACGVTPPMVSGWETGKVPVARDHYPALAKFFGLTVGEIATVGRPLACESSGVVDPIAAADPWAVGKEPTP